MVGRLSSRYLTVRRGGGVVARALDFDSKVTRSIFSHSGSMAETRGAQAPQWPGKIFFGKIEGLSSFTSSVLKSRGLPPAKSGLACYDNPTGRGVFLSDVQHVYLYSLFN